MSTFQEIHDSINIGQKYMVVGSRGGCSGRQDRCKDCHNFKQGIIVTGKEDTYQVGERSIHGKSIPNSSNHCSFDPRDLETIGPNWKKILGTKKRRLR